jgi:hypothetical protein
VCLKLPEGVAPVTSILLISEIAVHVGELLAQVFSFAQAVVYLNAVVVANEYQCIYDAQWSYHVGRDIQALTQLPHVAQLVIKHASIIYT